MRIVCLAAAVLFAGCTPSSSNGAAPGNDPLKFGSTTHTATFGQRDTQTVPNTVGRLSIVVGDVEGLNLVETVELIDHKDEGTVLTATNLRVGTTKSFEIDDVQYDLKLIATDSSHVLHDTATFEFSLASR